MMSAEPFWQEIPWHARKASAPSSCWRSVIYLESAIALTAPTVRKAIVPAWMPVDPMLQPRAGSSAASTQSMAPSSVRRADLCIYTLRPSCNAITNSRRYLSLWPWAVNGNWSSCAATAPIRPTSAAPSTRSLTTGKRSSKTWKQTGQRTRVAHWWWAVPAHQTADAASHDGRGMEVGLLDTRCWRASEAETTPCTSALRAQWWATAPQSLPLAMDGSQMNFSWYAPNSQKTWRCRDQQTGQWSACCGGRATMQAWMGTILLYLEATQWFNVTAGSLGGEDLLWQLEQALPVVKDFDISGRGLGKLWGALRSEMTAFNHMFFWLRMAATGEGVRDGHCNHGQTPSCRTHLLREVRMLSQLQGSFWLCIALNLGQNPSLEFQK